MRDVGSETAQLDAQVDPGGAATTYAFRYSAGAVPSAGEPCAEPSCGETPKPRGSLGALFGDRTVTAKLPLAPGTTYQYRVVAFNEHGGATGAEGSFTTLPATSAAGEADGRVWEMVSPPDRGGGDVQAIDEGPNVLIQAATDGDAISYGTDAPVGTAEGSRSYEPTQMLATRGSAGWFSQDIVTPNEYATSLPPATGAGAPPEYEFFSEDLSLALVHPPSEFELGKGSEGISNLAEPPLSPPVTRQEEEKGQERTVYVRADRPVAPAQGAEATLYDEAVTDGRRMEELAAAKSRSVENPGYVALLSDADVLPGAAFGGEKAVSFEAANAGLTAAVLDLNTGIAGAEAGLYEWIAGKLKPVNVPPCESAGCENVKLIPGRLGDGKNKRHAISDDGSRIFWESEETHHLYMRDTDTPPADPEREETIQLDEVQGGSGEGPALAVFQTASADGSRVFFTDEQALTPGSGAAVGKPDLYVCEIVENAEHALECKLSDLTPVQAGERADVQGTVLGANEEGSYVYFVADGVLTEAEGAGLGSCQPGDASNWREAVEEGRLPLGATCNLYAERYEAGRWVTTFVATLSEADAADWESSFAAPYEELEQISARVSPDGRYLAFMSDRPLTSFDGQPYDNDATAAGAGNAPAEEVYEYDADTGRLVCASCNPSGGRPVGVFDPFVESTEHARERLLVDPASSWAGRWLAGSIPGWTGVVPASSNEPYALYQSRYLSNSGRLFFDSPEALVPSATNGKEDVYEYEPVGVPQGAHQCAAASATYGERVGGCVGLISSGTSSEESAFVDASETGGEGPHGEELDEGGGDVFFVTAGKLVPQDTEAGVGLYDAHECTGASPCIVAPATPSPTVCESGEGCRPFAYSPPAATTLASGSPSGQGNMPAKHGVSASSTVKPLTRAQELAKALEACRSKYRHERKKRAACERSAQKRYGPVKKEKAKRAGKSDVHKRRQGAAR